MAEPSSAAGPLDLDAYLARIGVSLPLPLSLETLQRLSAAHAASIPFENLDVRLGRPIRLDLESLQAKLVAARRGGYCFEQNALFAAVLARLGFPVTTLEARVQPTATPVISSRSHMVLRVEAGGASWLADVGFGGDGPTLPVRLDGAVSEQPLGPFRVVREGGYHVLQSGWGGGWAGQYVFGLEPAWPIDYLVANHYTSTWPESIFVRTPTLQLSLAGESHVLRRRSYTVRTAAGEAVRTLSDDEALQLARERFGIALPEDELRRALR